MLSPIPSATLTGVRQLADKMEKILLVALEHYGNTFVEPKVELGARFGHLVCEYPPSLSLEPISHDMSSAFPRYLSGHSGFEHRTQQPQATTGDATLLEQDRL